MHVARLEFDFGGATNGAAVGPLGFGSAITHVAFSGMQWRDGAAKPKLNDSCAAKGRIMTTLGRMLLFRKGPFCF